MSLRRDPNLRLELVLGCCAASPIGGSAPKPPGFIAFFPPEWIPLGFLSREQAGPAPSPFRPLSRSLGLLPSMALSRPTQVRLVLTEPARRATKKQRMVYCPKFPCLTLGVHSTVSAHRRVDASGRGRDGHRWPPPAQIRTSGITAYGSYLGWVASNRTSG